MANRGQQDVDTDAVLHRKNSYKQAGRDSFD